MKAKNYTYFLILLFTFLLSCNENRINSKEECNIEAFSNPTELLTELNKNSSYNVMNYLRVMKTLWLSQHLKAYNHDSLSIKLLKFPWLLQPNYDTSKVTIVLFDSMLDQSTHYRQMLISNLFCEDLCYSSVSQYSSSIKRKSLSNIGNECLMILANSHGGKGGILESPDKSNYNIDSLKESIISE